MESSYENIINACRDLRDGKFIMSSANIERLLQCIVSSQDAYSYVLKCNELYKYGNELNIAVQPNGFVMPINKCRIIVLVTGLLRQFLLFERKTGSNSDEGIDFYMFLRKYYPSIDVDKSFSLFVDNVIFPYAKAFKGMFEDISEEESDSENTGEWVEKLSTSVKEQLYPCITNLNDKIVTANDIPMNKKKEYLLMIEGFNHVLEVGNTKMLKVMYIGLKNTLQDYRDVESHLKFIEETLISFKMI